VPDRTTLSRRYKAFSPVLQDFIAFVGQYAEDLDPQFTSQDLYTDKSLFKAQGPVWHQRDRQVGRIPDKLRHLDTDASWSKSGYHGWVYGYGLHLVDNRVGFPKWVQLETAAVAESDVIDQQAVPLIEHFHPETVSTDNSYAKARRIRQWATQGVVLLSPTAKWVKGRYATAYHRYIQQPENAELLRSRRTAIEPVFDLIAHVLGTTAKQKQLPIQKLANVRTCLALATLSVQVAMIANSIWGLPLRNISTMAAAFTCKPGQNILSTGAEISDCVRSVELLKYQRWALRRRPPHFTTPRPSCSSSEGARGTVGYFRAGVKGPLASFVT
jgi:hypothetical protein